MVVKALPIVTAMGEACHSARTGGSPASGSHASCCKGAGLECLVRLSMVAGPPGLARIELLRPLPASTETVQLTP